MGGLFAHHRAASRESIQAARGALSLRITLRAARWLVVARDAEYSAGTSMDLSPRAGSSTPGAPFPPRIGRYAIFGVLGEGGMGTVYAAQQDNPKRAVALKVIRAGCLSPELLRRFTQESQVLARLHHQGIAQVYEAGMAADERGQDLPFFAMEFIEGLPLTEYAKKKSLGTRERLELIARVSDAVDHAHQKGVIHRDLKPGNILVDESGQPKILDFGIARATDSDIQQTTLRTDIGQLVGTIPYMSPEQVSGDPNELDTRSDVYALGVVAYELLTGRLPYDLARKMIHEAVRIIQVAEPTRLSSLDRTLSGDVETIVGKALEKDKARRYPTADSFASDIRRYLKHEPIAARPASTWYQFEKFSRRNPGLVAGVGAALVLLVAGVVGTSIALRRALRAETDLTEQLTHTNAARAESDRQRTLAESNAAAETKARKRAEAINKFVTDALESSDAMADGKQDSTIAGAMENAVREIEAGAFRDDPETEANLLATIGVILKNDGKYERAAPILERALAMSESSSGANSTEVAACLNHLAQLHIAADRGAQAEPLLERSIAIFESVYGPEHAEVATGLSSLAHLYYVQGQHDRAEPFYERSLAIREKLRGPDHREVATTLNDLALVRMLQQDHAEAEQLMTRALSIFEKALGPDHPDVAATLNSLAFLQEELGRNAEAEALYVRALSICEKALRPDHPLVGTALHNLADLYRELGELAKAEALYLRALVEREKSLGPDHLDVGLVLTNLGWIYQAQNRYAEAEPLYTRALAIEEKARGPTHVEVARALNNLGWAHEAQGHFLEAEAIYERTIAIREELLGSDDIRVGYTLNNLSRVRQALGKTTEARASFDRAIAILRRATPEGSPNFARVLWFSAKARMENDDAVSALAELEEAVAMAEKVLPADHEHLVQYRRTYSDCRAAVAK